jgi:hypothetical protein
MAGGPFLELDDLPPALLGDYAEFLLPALHDRSTMRAWGSRYARLVLERCSNNKRQACRQLGISYHRRGRGEEGSEGNRQEIASATRIGLGAIRNRWEQKGATIWSHSSTAFLSRFGSLTVA